MEELKPCPFCGGKAEILISEYEDSRKEYLVACTECDGMVERWREVMEEFENPTPLDGDTEKWKLSVALNCHAGSRKRSMTELLFCMVRSWN